MTGPQAGRIRGHEQLIGELRERRCERGTSLAELAESRGVDRERLEALEGGRDVLIREELEAWARGLDASELAGATEVLDDLLRSAMPSPDQNTN